ncbi:hypothetical protein [Klebsiella pneumoniae]|uniref:aldose epimerase family protein n=1 Tax=Klebsiella pneumoniae TaxID=573 RepID=UPI00234C81BB|nr:hypothetical protein [Klebsiella pneumoniae]MDC6592806.1 hypothetical protein [Klebsiella pneumoniae]
MTYRATVDQPCPVNMTNHVYFNLDGEQGDVRQHQPRSSPRGICWWKADGIPGGELKDVANTSFDFRQPKTIAADFLADADQQKVKDTIMPSCWMPKATPASLVAQVWSQDGKLQMTVYTSAPGAAVLLPVTIRRHPRRRRRSPTPTGRDWRWRANSCRIRRTIRSPQPDCVLRPPGVCQPDGISVYRPIIASALHQGALLFRPRPPLCRLFFSNLLYFPSPKDKK